MMLYCQTNGLTYDKAAQVVTELELEHPEWDMTEQLTRSQWNGLDSNSM